MDTIIYDIAVIEYENIVRHFWLNPPFDFIKTDIAVPKNNGYLLKLIFYFVNLLTSYSHLRSMNNNTRRRQDSRLSKFCVIPICFEFS